MKSSHYLLHPCLLYYCAYVPLGTKYGLYKGAEEGKSVCTCQLGFPENAPLHWSFSYESFLRNQ